MREGLVERVEKVLRETTCRVKRGKEWGRILDGKGRETGMSS